MKKILLTALSVILIFALLCGCGKSKTAMTAEAFIQSADDAGYSVSDSTEFYSEISYIEKATAADSADGAYTIMFFEINDPENALLFYEIYEQLFMINAGDDCVDEMQYGDNYERHEATSAGFFFTVSRIDSTVVFVAAESAYQPEIAAFLSQIGY